MFAKPGIIELRITNMYTQLHDSVPFKNTIHYMNYSFLVSSCKTMRTDYSAHYSEGIRESEVYEIGNREPKHTE